jgi:hypothetical protein
LTASRFALHRILPRDDVKSQSRRFERSGPMSAMTPKASNWSRAGSVRRADIALRSNDHMQ